MSKDSGKDKTLVKGEYNKTHKGRPAGKFLKPGNWDQRQEVLFRDDDLPLLREFKSPYSTAEILGGVLAYTLTANTREAERLTGIPHDTIRSWKKRCDWWDEALAYCRKVKQDELDANFTTIIHKAAAKLDNMLDKDILEPKEIMQAVKIIFDTRQLVRGDPTNITRKDQDTDSTMKALMLRFEEMSRQITQDKPKIIEGEVINE
jgi:hypothetical protein